MFQLHCDYPRGYSYSSFYSLHLHSIVQVFVFEFLQIGFALKTISDISDIDVCRLRCVIVKLTRVCDSNKTSCDIELQEVESDSKLLRA